MQEKEWTSEWPKTEESFWFYGWRSSLGRDRPPEIVLARVRRASNAFVYIAGATLIYENDALGVWLKAEVPAPPQKLLKALVSQEQEV